MIPRSEAQRAFRDRDAAKRAARAAQTQAQLLASRLGIDPSDLQLVETGNPDNPFELRGESLEELTRTLSTAKEQKLAEQKKRGQWEEREKELQAAYMRQIQKREGEHNKQSSAFTAWLRKHAATTPLQQACAAEGVIDQDGSGAYSDVLKLLGDRVKVEHVIEEGELHVQVTALHEDGTPMIKANGEAASVRDLVASFVSARPYLKRANFRSGPGAGGIGNGSSMPAITGRKLTRAEGAKIAAARMFGRPIPPM